MPENLLSIQKTITILAIESSCDETSASVCKDGKILSNIIANQTVHEKYGGVVPELASRAHMQNIVPVVDLAMKTACISVGDLDALAFTYAPGLIGSLLVGSQFAKSMALALQKPIIPVHHMQAHVLANLIPDQKPTFPFLCLTVSGGHTQIIMAHSPTNMTILGETLDDAAGEAFDKSAKILGLPYPGGPLIEKFAKGGDPKRFAFTEPKVAGLNFSFSGLKTSILYFLQKEQKLNQNFITENLKDICASIQYRIISILINKLKKAFIQTGITEICLAGGVAANGSLRCALQQAGELNGWKTYIPPLEYCTDNAAMIGISAYFKYLAGSFSDLSVNVSARADCFQRP